MKLHNKQQNEEIITVSIIYFKKTNNTTKYMLNKEGKLSY